MVDYRRHEIVSGLFVVAAVVLFTLFAFRVGGLDLFAFVRPDAVTCRAYFADAKTLEVGAKVTTGGRRVGQVRAIRIAARALSGPQVQRLLDSFGAAAFPGLQPGMKRQMVEVEFELRDRDLRVDVDTARVRIAQEGLLGRHFLALDPGYWHERRKPPPVLEAEHREPLVLSPREAGGFEDLMASLRPIVRRADAILAKLDEGFLADANVARIGDLLENLDVAISEIRAVLDRDDPEGLRRTVLEPIGRVLARAEGLLERGPSILSSVDRAVRTTSDILDESRPRLRRVLEELAAASDDLDRRIAELHADLRRIAGNVNGLLAENRAEVAETARRMRRTMWQAEMAMRKIRGNPAFLLFGDDGSDLEAAAVDHSDLLRSGRARPYSQRDESDDGR